MLKKCWSIAHSCRIVKTRSLCCCGFLLSVSLLLGPVVLVVVAPVHDHVLRRRGLRRSNPACQSSYYSSLITHRSAEETPGDCFCPCTIHVEARTSNSRLKTGAGIQQHDPAPSFFTVLVALYRTTTGSTLYQVLLLELEEFHVVLPSSGWRMILNSSSRLLPCLLGSPDEHKDCCDHSYQVLTRNLQLRIRC